MYSIRTHPVPLACNIEFHEAEQWNVSSYLVPGSTAKDLSPVLLPWDWSSVRCHSGKAGNQVFKPQSRKTKWPGPSSEMANWATGAATAREISLSTNYQWEPACLKLTCTWPWIDTPALHHYLSFLGSSLSSHPNFQRQVRSMGLCPPILRAPLLINGRFVVR